MRTDMFSDSCFAMLASIPSTPSPMAEEVSIGSWTEISVAPQASRTSSSGAIWRMPWRVSR